MNNIALQDNEDVLFVLTWNYGRPDYTNAVQIAAFKKEIFFAVITFKLKKAFVVNKPEFFSSINLEKCLKLFSFRICKIDNIYFFCFLK